MNDFYFCYLILILFTTHTSIAYCVWILNSTFALHFCHAAIKFLGTKSFFLTLWHTH